MNYLKIISLILLATVLSNCAGAFVAGATAGGMVVYDRRTLETIADDQAIRHLIAHQIGDDLAFQTSHIGVSSFNRTVLLTGQTPLASVRARAEKIAYSAGNVRRVYNEIAIATPTSAGTRSSDTWLTTKVKTSLIATKGLSSSDIKVVTENSTVYLMGKVSHSQANLAVDTARRVAGVEKIVRVFEYLS